jgi:hypothetical protein
MLYEWPLNGNGELCGGAGFATMWSSLNSAMA